MPTITSHFATEIYQAELPHEQVQKLNPELEATISALCEDDEAGLRWCDENGYPGYTSYASLNDLPWRFPPFQTLAGHIDEHVKTFSDHLGFDLAGAPLTLDTLWVNVLPEGGSHSGHIHPHSVLSGTYYVAVPDGASAIRFEDPRLAMMMARPTLVAAKSEQSPTFKYIAPSAGTLLLWESWLRHEVVLNEAEAERISVSFNYRWGK